MQVDDEEHMEKERNRALERIVEDTRVLGQAEEKQPTIESERKSSEKGENQRKVSFLRTKRRDY